MQRRSDARPSPPGARRADLARNVGGSIALALLVNAVIFGLGWNRAGIAGTRPFLAPPDWVVGAVWVGLFATMGYARYLIVRSAGGAAARDARLVVVLIVFCALYPLYTAGLSDLKIATAGNIATLLLVLYVARLVLREHRRAAACIVPVALWVTFATYLSTASLLARA